MFERYAAAVNAPVVDDTAVFSATPIDEVLGGGYEVVTSSGMVRCRFLVAATGAMATPFIPTIAAGAPGHVHQTSPKYYKRPSDLPEGEVLVVGASASGIQLARELQLSGRQVTVAVGAHTRLAPHLSRHRHPRLARHDGHARSHDRHDRRSRGGAPRAVAAAGRFGGWSRHRPRRTPVARRPRRRPHRRLRLGCRLLRRHRPTDGRGLRRSAAEPACSTASMGSRPSAVSTARSMRSIARHAVRIEHETTELLLDRAGTVLWATGYRPDYSWMSGPAVEADGSIDHRRPGSPPSRRGCSCSVCR